MSNLGDSNTPVEGESFGLPAGAELTEDANGNLAIADSSGSIVLVRDETNAEWQFENTDLTGINSIDAGSANLGQVGGAITSDPITSLTDGELFVDSGTLTFTPSGGPEVNWIQSGASVVSVQLTSGESTTVPTGEDWMVSISVDELTDLTIDGNVAGRERMMIPRIVLESGTNISADGDILLQGFDVSNLSYSTVTAYAPEVPTGETWVGGVTAETQFTINSVDVFVNESASLESTPWVVLEENDNVGGGTLFGGFKI